MAARSKSAKPKAAAPGRSVDTARPSPTRTEILDAAAALIVDRGYGACTMRAVAERVKIQAGSLYYHFSSKDQIIEEILNTGIETLLAHVESRLSRLSPDAAFADRLKVAVEAHISSLVGGGAGHLGVYEHLPPILKRRSRAMRDRYAALWVELFTDGVRSGEVDPDLDLDLAIPFLLGGLNRVPEWFRKSRAKSGEVAEMVTGTLRRGVLAPSSSAAHGNGRKPSVSKAG